VASGVNDRCDISGFYTVAKVTHGFLLHGRHLSTLDFGAATNTQALGVNNSDQVVGSFVDAAGTMHGFVWRAGTLTQVDDPNGTPARHSWPPCRVPHGRGVVPARCRPG